MPKGFAGRIIYPNSIYLADLLIRFDQTMTDFSIMYSCQELGCDDAATMRVTAHMPTGILNQNIFTEGLIVPNPVSQSAIISFSLKQSENIRVAVYDIRGNLVKGLFEGHLNPGVHQINWNVNDDAVEGGVYFLNLAGENFSRSYKLVVVK